MSATDRLRWARLLLTSSALLALVACGADEPPPAAQASEPAVEDSVMVEESAASDDVDGEDVPEILSVTFKPGVPRSDEQLRAIVRTSKRAGAVEKMSFEWKVRGRSIRQDRPMIMLPTMRKGDVVTVEVVAKNSAGESDPYEADVEIGNLPPRILELRMSKREATTGGEEWAVEPWAEDPDGDSLTYRYAWIINGREAGIRSASLQTSQLKRGDRLRVRVVAHDGEEESAAAESAQVEIANTAPDISSEPTGLDHDGVLRYAIQARDPDGDRGLRYELVRGPEGMKMDEIGGLLTWAPTARQGGTHRIEIAVDDRMGGRSTQVFDLPVVVTGGESSPAAPR